MKDLEKYIIMMSVAGILFFIVPTATAITVAVIVVLVVVVFIGFGKREFIEIKDNDEYHKKNVGISFGPVQMQFFRILFSLGVGQIIALMLAMFDFVINEEMLKDWIFISFGLFIAALVWMKDQTPVNVPTNHMAIIKFYGRPLRIFLIHGDYPWYGEKLFFGVVMHPYPNKESKLKHITAGEKTGYTYVGLRTLDIWHDTVSKNPVLRSLSKNSTDVIARITIKIQTYDPIEWIFFNDPIKEICDRARAAFREITRNFVDVDVNALQSAITTVLEGDSIIVPFTIKQIDRAREGSVVRNRNGAAIHAVIPAKSLKDQREKEQIISNFLIHVKEVADSEYLEAATYSNNYINYMIITPNESIKQAVSTTGSIVSTITLSDVDLDPEVKKAYAQVSKELQERESEQMTARSVRDAAKVMGGSDAALAIAANISKVPGVKVHVIDSGDNKGKSDLGNKIITSAIINSDKD